MAHAISPGIFVVSQAEMEEIYSPDVFRPSASLLGIVE